MRPRKSPAPPKPGPSHEAVLAKVRGLYPTMCIAELLKVMGYSRTTMNNLVNESGVKRRSQSAEIEMTRQYNRSLESGRRRCVNCGKLLEKGEEKLCCSCNPETPTEAEIARRVEIEFGSTSSWFARNFVRVGDR